MIKKTIFIVTRCYYLSLIVGSECGIGYIMTMPAYSSGTLSIYGAKSLEFRAEKQEMTLHPVTP